MSSWREIPEHSTSGFGGLLADSYFVKRELRERPDPYASGMLKRQRVGESPQAHEIVSSGMRNLRASAKGGAGVPPFQSLSLSLVNSTQQSVQYSQSHDIQTLLNKVNEIESRLESLRPANKRDGKQDLQYLHSVINSLATVLPSRIKQQLNHSVEPEGCADKTKIGIEELVTATVSKNVSGPNFQNDLNCVEELLQKIKHAITTSSNINPGKRSNLIPLEKRRPRTEKRKFDWASDYEPMVQDHDEEVRRPKLTPRKLVFTFQPQDGMDVE